MAEFVGDGEPLTAWAMCLIHRNDRGVFLSDKDTAHSPEECAAFDAEVAQAFGSTDEDADLREGRLDHWWGIAAMLAYPLSEQEQAQVTRAKTGDFSGLFAHDENADWTRL